MHSRSSLCKQLTSRETMRRIYFIPPLSGRQRRLKHTVSADIFRISTDGVPVLQRPRPAFNWRQKVTKPPKSSIDVSAATADIDDVSMTDLRTLVKQKAWTDVKTQGRGRTKEKVQQEVVAKLRDEELSALVGLGQPQVITTSGDLQFATTLGFSDRQYEGWNLTENASDRVVSKLVGDLLTLLAKLHEPQRACKWTKWMHRDVRLVPTFRFQGLIVNSMPCVSVMLRYAAQATENLNLSEIGAGVSNESDLVGLEVACLTTQWRFVIAGYAGELGQNGLRDKLLDLTRSEETRAAIQHAPDSEKCWCIRFKDGSSARELTYLGSRLQVTLTLRNCEMLEKVLSVRTATALGKSAILSPLEREHHINEELSRLASAHPDVVDRVFPKKPERPNSGVLVPGTLRGGDSRTADAANPFASCFSLFEPPKLLVGGGAAAASPDGSKLWSSLERHGLYRYHLGQDVNISGIVLGRHAGPEDMKKASHVYTSIVNTVEKLRLNVNASSLQVASSIEEAVRLASSQNAHACVFLATGSASKMYFGVKDACLNAQAPGLAHMASQWINLTKPNHNGPALCNIALQLCAKLGHTPYVLAGSPARNGPEPLILGIDVCHMHPNTGWQLPNKKAHVYACFMLQKTSGEVEESWICQGEISGESIPNDVWKAVLSKALCAGREVVIHRDGRFTEHEKDFLADLASDIGVSGDAFGMVEVVKYAGLTPRMYSGQMNAPAGSFVRFSSTEGMLAAGSCRHGTRKPLSLRVLPARQLFSIQRFNEAQAFGRRRLRYFSAET
eukprot:TRINITY_DN23698_c0_g1_i2.p1 TRINITY_DN23698_c0_g1~~TRINITY_DN23698_c0_g1_i2.p1  ORF type:complete len:787 (-),score=65.82 TRINITY_DN23698_c0_g1_i2:49-2409(-)